MANQRGKRGARGIPGPAGPSGVTGAVGATGATGAQGDAGPRGRHGSPGSSQVSVTGDKAKIRILTSIDKHIDNIYRELDSQLRRTAKLQSELDDLRGKIRGLIGTSK